MSFTLCFAILFVTGRSLTTTGAATTTAVTSDPCANQCTISTSWPADNSCYDMRNRVGECIPGPNGGCNVCSVTATTTAAATTTTTTSDPCPNACAPNWCGNQGGTCQNNANDPNGCPICVIPTTTAAATTTSDVTTTTAAATTPIGVCPAASSLRCEYYGLGQQQPPPPEYCCKVLIDPFQQLEVIETYLNRCYAECNAPNTQEFDYNCGPCCDTTVNPYCGGAAPNDFCSNVPGSVDSNLGFCNLALTCEKSSNLYRNDCVPGDPYACRYRDPTGSLECKEHQVVLDPLMNELVSCNQCEEVTTTTAAATTTTSVTSDPCANQCTISTSWPADNSCYDMRNRVGECIPGANGGCNVCSVTATTTVAATTTSDPCPNSCATNNWCANQGGTCENNPNYNDPNGCPICVIPTTTAASATTRDPCPYECTISPFLGDNSCYDMNNRAGECIPDPNGGCNVCSITATTTAAATTTTTTSDPCPNSCATSNWCGYQGGTCQNNANDPNGCPICVIPTTTAAATTTSDVTTTTAAALTTASVTSDPCPNQCTISPPPADNSCYGMYNRAGECIPGPNGGCNVCSIPATTTAAATTTTSDVTTTTTGATSTTEAVTTNAVTTTADPCVGSCELGAECHTLQQKRGRCITADTPTQTGGCNVCEEESTTSTTDDETTTASSTAGTDKVNTRGSATEKSVMMAVLFAMMVLLWT